jgi:hypothetical protein
LKIKQTTSDDGDFDFVERLLFSSMCSMASLIYNV